MKKTLKKKLLLHLPVISRFIRQRDELKRCQKDLKVLRSKMDHLTAASVNQDFLDFSEFCRRHGITFEDG